MENIPDKIYRKYKKLNIIDLVYNEWASLIKWGMRGIFAMFLLRYFYKFNNYRIIELIFLGLSFLAFYEYTRRKFLRKVKHRNNTENINYDNVNSILMGILYSYIEKEGLNTKDGIEYLINVYKKKSRNKKFTMVAVGALFVSAVINNFFYIVFMGENKDWMRLYTYYLIVKVNFPMLITITILSLFFVVFIKYNVEMVIEIWGQKYINLVEILECRFLPIVIREKKEGTNLSENVLEIDFGIGDEFI